MNRDKRAELKANYDRLMAESLPEEEAKAKALQLFQAGAKQTSGKYRMFVVPVVNETEEQTLMRFAAQDDEIGELAREGLEEAARRAEDVRQDWIKHVFKIYLANRIGQSIQVDLRTYREFKALERKEFWDRYGSKDVERPADGDEPASPSGQ